MRESRPSRSARSEAFSTWRTRYFSTMLRTKRSSRSKFVSLLVFDLESGMASPLSQGRSYRYRRKRVKAVTDPSTKSTGLSRSQPAFLSRSRREGAESTGDSRPSDQRAPEAYLAVTSRSPEGEGREGAVLSAAAVASW